MKSLLLGAALALLAVPAYATLDCTILVDGTQVATCTTSTNGSLSFSSMTASPLFSSITLTGEGPPVLPQPDLSTVTLDVTTSGTFTGSHTLGVDIFQTEVSAAVGAMLESTGSINNLIGSPGPTTLSDFINGTASTLGTQLRSATFPVEAVGTFGPAIDTLTVPLTADAQSYAITFTGANQSANDTLQLEGVVPGVPEPTSLAILGTALTGLTLVAPRRRRS